MFGSSDVAPRVNVSLKSDSLCARKEINLLLKKRDPLKSLPARLLRSPPGNGENVGGWSLILQLMKLLNPLNLKPEA